MTNRAIDGGVVVPVAGNAPSHLQGLLNLLKDPNFLHQAMALLAIQAPRI